MAPGGGLRTFLHLFLFDSIPSRSFLGIKEIEDNSSESELSSSTFHSFYGETKDHGSSSALLNIWLSVNQGRPFHSRVVKPLMEYRAASDVEDKTIPALARNSNRFSKSYGIKNVAYRTRLERII